MKESELSHSELDETYLFKGELYKNNERLGEFEAMILIKDYEELKQLLVEFENIKNKSVRVNFGVKNEFFIRGFFDKVKLSKSLSNISIFNFHKLFGTQSQFLQGTSDSKLKVYETKNIGRNNEIASEKNVESSTKKLKYI